MKIFKNQKLNQNLWALKFIIECSFFVDDRLIGVPIRILILGLEKVKAGFEDVNSIGIHMATKHNCVCQIVNDLKWDMMKGCQNQKHFFSKNLVSGRKWKIPTYVISQNTRIYIFKTNSLHMWKFIPWWWRICKEISWKYFSMYYSHLKLTRLKSRN